MKKGIFPHFAEGLQTTSGSENWDGVSGFVKISGDHNVTFNTANYNGPDEPVIESGAAVFVQNSDTGNNNVIITGGQFSDADATTVTLKGGESVTVLYHETHGFMFMGAIEATVS